MNVATKVDVEGWSPRAPFYRYVTIALAAVLRRATLTAGGRPLRVEAIIPRGASDDGSVPWAIPSTARGQDLVEEHVAALLEVTLPEGAKGPITQGKWRTNQGLGGAGQWSLPDTLDGDFVFSYPAAEESPAGDMAEYGARVVAALLDVVDLVAEGSVVLPDALIYEGRAVDIPKPVPGRPATIGARADGRQGTGRRQPLHSVAATEPAIVVLARHWGMLARLLELEGSEPAPKKLRLLMNEAERPEPPPPLAIDGFRLRRPSDWVVPSSGHPSDVYEYLARVCNVACKFCYLYGNPSSLAVARGGTVISRDEMDTRLRYFDPARRRSLFQAQWEINEFLVDPKIYDVLPALRQKTDEPFYFITNGSPLKPAIVDLLAAVKPVHLIVSLNSIDEDVRADMMRERDVQTATAMSSLRLLVDRGIPFGISLAAFPEFSFDDLERTIRLAEQLPAAFVRINLPGFTRELPYDGHFDTETYWADVVRFIKRLRPSVSIPLITIPSAFEDNVVDGAPLAPRIVGAVRGSPAALGGLRPGDTIVAVNGIEVHTRAELQSLLLLMRGRIQLRGVRDGEPFACTIDGGAETQYPYAGHVICKYIFPHGVVLSPSLSRRNAREIADLVTEHGARSAWMITSRIMRPAGEALLAAYAPEIADRIRFVPAENEFLGGNIRILDMCVVGDLARALDREIARGDRPDLVLVSETGFNAHGRDLQGRHWTDLERWFGIPVRLVGVSRFPF